MLDPFLKKFIDKVSALHPIRFWEMPLPAARFGFAMLAQLAGAKDVPIGRVETLTMPGPGGPLALRLYVPEGCPTPSPGLVFFHGGGFVLGNLDVYDGFCRKFANAAGVRLVAVEYRLAPENPFPAAPDDAYAALCWVGARAATLGIDPARLAVGGDSAGGNLAAGICQRARDAAGPALAAQVLIAPLTHASGDYPSMRAVQNDPILSREAAQWFMDRYLQGADYDDPRVSPLMAADLRGLPPAYLLLGGADPLHDCGAAYGAKLKAAGVAVAVADYPDMMHDFVFLQSVLPQAETALAAAGAALRGVFL